MENCLFCKIASSEIPSNIVYEDQEIVAFADINPQAPFHVLLIPRRHITSAADITIGDGDLLTKLFITAKKLAHEHNLDQRGYRLVTNVGTDAGQSVFHLHFHMLGGRPLTWPPG